MTQSVPALLQGPVMRTLTLSYILRRKRIIRYAAWAVPEFDTLWLRELEMSPYRIVYRRDDAVVTVVRVWRSERLMNPGLEGNA